MSFQVFDAEKYLYLIFDFGLINDGPLTNTLEELGYGSQIWIINMSVNFFSLCFMFMSVIVSYLAMPCF
jgi:hypothetical protein